LMHNSASNFLNSHCLPFCSAIRFKILRISEVLTVKLSERFGNLEGGAARLTDTIFAGGLTSFIITRHNHEIGPTAKTWPSVLI
jgi:hypothetical protein